MANKTILIIDDDLVFSKLLAQAIAKRGFKTLVANNLACATQLTTEHTPDYAVVDLKMPDISGLELINILKSLSPAIEIVVLTGYASVATAVEAIKRGATHYLMKPAEVDEILQSFTLDLPTCSNIQHTDDNMTHRRLSWEYINQVMSLYNDNISKTAKHLGMHRRTLQRKLAKRP